MLNDRVLLAEIGRDNTLPIINNRSEKKGTSVTCIRKNDSAVSLGKIQQFGHVNIGSYVQRIVFANIGQLWRCVNNI